MLTPFPSTCKSPILPLCSVWMTYLLEFRHPLTDLPGKHTCVMGLFLHLGLGRFPSQNRGREKGHEDRPRIYDIQHVYLTCKYTAGSQSQSQQLALPPVQQGCPHTVARCMWRGVHTKHFSEPRPVAPALMQYKIRQVFPREHTVKHLFAVSQHNKMPLQLEDKAGLVSEGQTIYGGPHDSPSFYDINTLSEQHKTPYYNNKYNRCVRGTSNDLYI